MSCPFYLGAHEVTVGQFRRFAEAAPYQTQAEREHAGSGYNAATGRVERTPAYSWKNPGWEQTDRHPVTNVTWHDAQAFCEWLTHHDKRTYRLPTEAEWEYACRAGTQTAWFTGDREEALCAAANVADATLRGRLGAAWKVSAWADGYPFTAPVGSFRPNAWGLYDMHGNVWEWCQDGYRRYDLLDNRDPQASGAHLARVRRGGAWSFEAKGCRSAARVQGSPNDRFCDIGFRVVCLPGGRAP